MVTFSLTKSDIIRQHYVDAFVDTNSIYYLLNINKRVEFSDGFCYVGYLWDCLKKPVKISNMKILQILKNKKNFYIMWDIHSSDRILIPNYWKYPKSCVLFLKRWSDKIRNELPEDIYIFDATYTWSVIFTHETDINGEQYCLYVTNQGKQSRENQETNQGTVL